MRNAILFFAIVTFIVQCRSHRQASKITLQNTYWKLVEVSDTLVTTPVHGREVYMILTQEGNTGVLKGHAGCNGLGGSYETDGDKIKFQPITTRMYCALQMEVENLFTQMLSSADAYRINGEMLELYSGSDLLGRFKQVSKA